MTQKPRIGVWFAASATLFFARALLFATWLASGPEVKASLQLDTGQFGLLSMLYPIGGLLGILFASSLTNRFGSGRLTIIGFSLAALGLAGLGIAVPAGNVVLSSLCLVAMGLPMAIADYLGNFEGTAVDKASKRSLFPAIHAAWGIGMMLAAAVYSYFSTNQLGLGSNLALIATLVAASAIWAGTVFPKRASEKISATAKKAHSLMSRKVWTEKRTLLIAVIGFAFIMAEVSAGTWVPIALTNSGSTQAEAAATFGAVWVVITLTRLVGGAVVEKIGRSATILASTLITAAGIGVFMLDNLLHLPLLGLVLWGLGMAMGFPMSVSAMSDDPEKSAARINMIITVVYISSIAVGPALGAVGQALNIYAAFAVPLVLMLLSAVLSRVTKPENKVLDSPSA